MALVSPQSNLTFAPLHNDFHRLSLSMGEPVVDEAAAAAKLNTSTDMSRRMLVTSGQIDAYHPIEDKLYINEKEKLFGIFDGHGGDICSKYISDRLPKIILDKLARSLRMSQSGVRIDFGCVLKQAFIEADTAFLNEHKSILRHSPTGSCGVVVLERDGFLYICNLGDSRVQLTRRDENGCLNTLLLTNDHNTKNEDEVKKVLERTSDPMPIRANISTNTEGKRVGGVLMLTRAFGDGVFKRRDMSMPPFINYLPYITSEPEINVHKIDAADQFVVIASDGLYEHFTPEQVAHFIGDFLREISTADDVLLLPQQISKIGNMVIAKELEVIAGLMKKTVEEVKKLPNRKSFMDDTTLIVLLLNR